MQIFPGYLLYVNKKNTQYGAQIGFVANNIDVEDIVGDADDQSLRDELESCKQFLTDTEKKNGRHRVFNFAMSSFDIPLLNDKGFCIQRTEMCCKSYFCLWIRSESF